MFVSYLKMTNYCNVGCDFCYLPEATRSDKTRMSRETLVNAIKQSEAAALSERFDSVLYVFHGGEPLTMSAEIIDEYCQIIEDSARLPFKLTLQTSLLPLRRSHFPVISKWFNGFIGSSIDFSGRTIKGSVSDYLTLWLEKANFATSNGFEVVPTFVPSTDDIGNEQKMVDWFYEHGFNRFNTERYNLGTDNSTRPTNLQHSEILRNLTCAILKYAKKGIFLSNNVVEAAINGVINGQPGDRWGGGCIKSFYVVNPSGKIHFCPDLIETNNSFGSVNENPIEIITSIERNAFSANYLIHHKNMNCSNCEFRSWCRSGCPITSNDVISEGECSGYKRYLLWLKGKNNEELMEYVTGALITVPGDMSGVSYG